MIRLVRFGTEIVKDAAYFLAALALTVWTGRRHFATWYGTIEREA